MERTKVSPLTFIEALRDSFWGSTVVYTEGSCLELYRLLKVLYPNAELWYNEDHALTCIDGRWYDILGEWDEKVVRGQGYTPQSPKREFQPTKFDIFKHRLDFKRLKELRHRVLFSIKRFDVDAIADITGLHKDYVTHSITEMDFIDTNVAQAIQDLYDIDIVAESYKLYSKSAVDAPKH